jgi:hypothetical protein
MNWKGRGRKRSCPNLRYYPAVICLDVLRKTTRNFSRDSNWPSQDSNGGQLRRVFLHVSAANRRNLSVETKPKSNFRFLGIYFLKIKPKFQYFRRGHKSLSETSSFAFETKYLNTLWGEALGLVFTCNIVQLVMLTWQTTWRWSLMSLGSPVNK